MATKRAKNPQEIATAAVQRWFTDMVGSGDTLTSGDYDVSGPISQAYEEIELILEDRHVQQYGPIRPDQDLTRLMFGRESGYLVGVQVGLRLRARE